MGVQEEPGKKKEFQRRTDDDIDSFLSRKEFSKTAQTGSEKPPITTSSEKPATSASASSQEPAKEPTVEEQITAARESRAEREAYKDVAFLRKKAHALSHKAAKFYHKYKVNEEKAQKCSAKAVAFREKAAERKDRARNFREKIKEYESEMTGAAQGKSDLSPESLRTKVATFDRKAAKQEEVAMKNESKAAAQTAKAAAFRTKAAKLLEQNKLNESESKRYARRADNLEKAGL